MKYPFVFNKTYHEWPTPFISEEELRKLGIISLEVDIYLREQGEDQKISKENPVDLARNGIEQIYTAPKEKYQFIVNEKLFVSPEPFITEAEIRAVGRISKEETIYFRVEGPDRKISIGEKIDLRPFPIEEFYSTLPREVHITINNKKYNVKPGKYSVAELKKIGHVSPAHELDQLVDNKLIHLEDNTTIIIRGCEEFKSHPRDGSSS